MWYEVCVQCSMRVIQFVDIYFTHFKDYCYTIYIENSLGVFGFYN